MTKNTVATQHHVIQPRDIYNTASATITDTAIVSIGPHLSNTNMQQVYSRPVPSYTFIPSMLSSNIAPPPGFHTSAAAAHQTYSCSTPMVGSIPRAHVGETIYSTLNPSANVWPQGENTVVSNAETLRYPTNNQANISFIQQQKLLDAMTISKPQIMNFNGDNFNL